MGSKQATAILAVLVMSASPLMGQRVNAPLKPPEKNSQSGTICVLPNPPEPPTRYSPGGKYDPDTLTARIDRREAIRWPHKSPLRIGGLALDDRHLVVLTSDGKRIQSFWFKFADADNGRLCMSFDGYEGVQMGSQKDALWCKCKQSTASLH